MSASRHKLPLAHITLQIARHPPQRSLIVGAGSTVNSVLQTRSVVLSRVARLGPGQQRIKGGTQFLSPFRQAILDLRRHLMVDDPPDNAVALQLPELLDQHLLRDRRYRPLKIGKAKHLPAKEMEQNYQLPAALQKLERLLHAGGRSGWRVFVLLT